MSAVSNCTLLTATLILAARRTEVRADGELKAAGTECRHITNRRPSSAETSRGSSVAGRDREDADKSQALTGL
jgi:hypothetical protein